MGASFPHRGGPLQRIAAEYLEMPGLQLTAAQVERLCGLDAATCATALATLVDLRFLKLTPTGCYVRAEGANWSTAAAIASDSDALRPASKRRRSAR